MNIRKILLWESKEYQYEGSYGFTPFLMSYIHDEDENTRPCMLVVPGGGYCMVSPTEGEIVAKKFYEKGFNAFVCTYTTNLMMNHPLREQPMKDLSRAIRYIRKNAAELYVDVDKLVICGFSAGAHLCGSVCVHYNDVMDENEEYQMISNKPNAAILSYPVITSGPSAHKDSFVALLGADASEKQLEYMSLEKHVTSQTPPCFIWQTATDELVPVENSALFAQACKDADIKFAYHVFSKGQHGLSLADEEWANANYGNPYTMEQMKYIIDKYKQEDGPLPDILQYLEQMTNVENDEKPSEESQTLWNDWKPNAEVAIWPELADTWLHSIFTD